MISKIIKNTKKDEREAEELHCYLIGRKESTKTAKAYTPVQKNNTKRINFSNHFLTYISLTFTRLLKKTKK